MNRPLHARSLAALFRATIVAVAATSVATACSASGDAADAGPDGATCAPAGPFDAGASCARSAVVVPLAPGATASACGFATDGAAPPSALCERFCGPGFLASCAFVAEGPAVRCIFSCPVDGRRPEGLEPAPCADSLGAWLATMAHNEAAAVHAFEALAGELAAHGAPRALLRGIARARADEVRHARDAAALARRHGARVARPRVQRPPCRALRDIALENAREGCVRETVGAMVGMIQAERAATPALRAFYAGVARDETRHAALSWRMHAWMTSRLSPGDAREVEQEIERTLRAVTLDAPAEARAALGIPASGEVQALASALFAALDAA